MCIESAGEPKNDLLVVLDRPAVSLNTNSSGRDLHPLVIWRKLSATTRSDRWARLLRCLRRLRLSCIKLTIASWDFLGHRLGVVWANALSTGSRQAPLSHCMSVMIAAGHEDGIEPMPCDNPVFRMVLDRRLGGDALCSHSTASRPENRHDVRALVSMGRTMVDFHCGSSWQMPRRIILDVGDTR